VTDTEHYKNIMGMEIHCWMIINMVFCLTNPTISFYFKKDSQMKYLCTPAIYHKTRPALPPLVSRMCTVELCYYWLRIANKYSFVPIHV